VKISTKRDRLFEVFFATLAGKMNLNSKSVISTQWQLSLFHLTPNDAIGCAKELE